MLQPRQSTSGSMLQPAKVSRVGQPEGGWLSALPNDLKLLILEEIPMLKLAQIAFLCKELHAAYRARVALRQAIIDSLPRVSRATPGSRPETLGDLIDSLPPSFTALPRDLVGVPEMKENLQVEPCPFTREMTIDLGKGPVEGHYIGFCWRGEPSGPGDWTSTDYRYLGTWQEAIQEGHGEAWSSSPQENYFGEWHYSTKNGHGEATWEDSKYVGGWMCSMRHGGGEYTWGDDGRYLGGFEYDEYQGFGVKTGDGEAYVGNFERGMKEGQGVKTWPGDPHGITYVGEWREGRLHGQGTMCFGEGSEYVGGWENNEHAGQGEMTWVDGSTYAGEWKRMRRHGWGTQKWASGAEYTGMWEDDEEVEDGEG